MGISLKGFGNSGSGDGAAISGITALPPVAAGVRLPEGSVIPTYVGDAVVFDGTNDYLTRTGNLTDSNQGIFSGWIKAGSDGASMYVYGGKGYVEIQRTNTNNFQILLSSGGGATTVYLRTEETLTIADGWVHCLASWSGTTRHMYVNDVASVLNQNGGNGALTDWSRGSFSVGSRTTAGVDKFNGGMFDIYIAPGQYLDLSIEANRRKFIDVTGKPVDLGIDGSIPTGLVSSLFFHLDNGEIANNFATNAGSGGAMTIVGALTTSSTSPTD